MIPGDLPLVILMLFQYLFVVATFAIFSSGDIKKDSVYEVLRVKKITMCFYVIRAPGA